ncbi:MAG: T9SS type A sorting domain-containing protein [bacterium]|nr:T9SS type A sorting domain-containing protein [bacterium]
MRKILLLLTVVALATPSAAYLVYYYNGKPCKWDPNDLPCDRPMNSAGTPDCSGEITQLQNSLDTWTDVTNCFFEFSWDGTTSTYGTQFDGINLMYWAESNPPYGGGYIAVNTFWLNAHGDWYYVPESDICFNGLEYTWSDSGQGGRMDVANIATHELGHTLVLADLYGGTHSEKTMYGYASAGETKKRTLHPDDIAGIRYLFPEGSGVDDDDPTNPVTFSLSAAYPNPSSGMARVAFTVPETATLELELYDVKGRKVDTLAEGEYAAGEYEAEVNGLSSGVYLYRLTSGNFAETKKMVVQ